jgi:DNA repair protein RadC
MNPAPLLGEPPIKAWPAAERPRERLLALGARDLTEAELIAVILGRGSRGSSALVLARQVQALAQARGGFQRLEAPDLADLPGFGPAKAAALLAGLEWGRRLGAAPATLPASVDGSNAALEALKPLLGGRQQEHMAVLALDARRRVLAAQLVSQGTLTQALAHPREVFRAAIKLGAAAIVVGHNHPSGDPSPSPDDDRLTRQLRQAAEVLAIPLLDHVIVGERGTFSYAVQGWPR